MAEERIGIDIEVRLDQLKEQLRETERMVGRTAASVDRSVTRSSARMGGFAAAFGGIGRLAMTGAGIGAGLAAFSAVRNAAMGLSGVESPAFALPFGIGGGARVLGEAGLFAQGLGVPGAFLPPGVGALGEQIIAERERQRVMGDEQLQIEAGRRRRLAQAAFRPQDRIEMQAEFARADARRRFSTELQAGLAQPGGISAVERRQLERTRDMQLEAIQAERGASMRALFMSLPGTETVNTALGPANIPSYHTELLQQIAFNTRGTR